MTKWKRVVPIPKVSNPSLFKGLDQESLIKETYGESEFKEVRPAMMSSHKNFTTDKKWNGLYDFNQRKQQTEEAVKRLKLFNKLKNKNKKHDPLPVPGSAPIKVNLVKNNNQYPRSTKYYYTTRLERIDFDKEKMNDIYKGKSIPIKEPQGAKKDVKSRYSIYSPDFGANLDDANPFGNRYTCRCGATQMQVNEGMICPNCGHPVEYKGDDFKMFGWVTLEDDYVIHSGLYKSIEFFIGKTALGHILDYKDEKDENGFSVQMELPKDEPFAYIGMMGFHEHFDEIMDHYLKVKPDKAPYYEDIMNDRDKVFTHSIPVYTLLLRPYRMKDDKFDFTDINGNFQMIAKLGALLNNKKSIKGRGTNKIRNELLFDLQFNINEVYDAVIKIMSSKKGVIRSLYGGRCNYTSRAVITPNWRLRTDQVKLPYHSLCELLQQSIINILNRTYGMPMHTARAIWEKAQDDYDERVYCIIKYIISAYKEGIPVFINRPPTIQYGSILAMYCVGISGDNPNDFTMEVPLLVLPALVADKQHCPAGLKGSVKIMWLGSWEPLKPLCQICKLVSGA